ncbi:MAG: hypothetical protein ABIS69_08990 [Sediminibacterium sp.]
MRKIFLSLLLIFCANMLHAQKTIILEKLRCFSSLGLTMNYFKDEATRKTIASQLNKALLKFQSAQLSDSTTISNIDYLSSTYDILPLNISYTDTDTAHLHLYLDVFEIAPTGFFAFPENVPADTSILKRARSIFLLKATLCKADKSIIYSEQLSVVIGAAETSGMGIVYSHYNNIGRLQQIVATPKGFAEILRASYDLLLNPNTQLEMIEMKVSPAFFADNFILRHTINQPRTFVSTTKNISTFNFNDKREMIRMGDAVYEEVLLRGKKAQTYPGDITAAIKMTNHYFNSDFVFLRQECRDVIRDKNYLLKLTVQIDPENMFPQPFVFTNFLPGKFHYLLLENDTVARFNIMKGVTETDKKLSLNKVSNGNDSSSLFTVSNTNADAWVKYDYVVAGNISNQKFTIKCSGFTNTLKEIYINNKLVCIAQGKFSPEKFVVFDASLSSELLNQLFMIGFNRFFE